MPVINITDLVVLICAIVFIINGLSRGFLRSLVGPLALIISWILIFAVYQYSRNIILCILLSVFAPMLFSWALGGLFNLWYPREDWKPNILSQMAGAFLTLIWGLLFVGILLIALSVIPPSLNESVKKMHEDINRSLCYKSIRPWINQLIPALKPDAQTPRTPPSRQEMETLSKDPRFQAIEQDPQIQKAIADKNYTQLMSNPKVLKLSQQILQDPKLLKKVMRMSQAQSATVNSKP